LEGAGGWQMEREAPSPGDHRMAVRNGQFPVKNSRDFEVFLLENCSQPSIFGKSGVTSDFLTSTGNSGG